MNDILLKKTWTKNWSGNWCLLLGSLYGDIYTSGIKELVGRGFKNFIITFESGTSSNYLKKDLIIQLVQD